MKRYVLLYIAPHGVAERFAQATPEEAQTGMNLWLAWEAKLGAALVDLGKPLGNARTITRNGVASSNSTVVGMSIVQANTMDDAVEMVKDHHHLHWADECEILVSEEMPIPELSA